MLRFYGQADLAIAALEPGDYRFTTYPRIVDKFKSPNRSFQASKDRLLWTSTKANISHSSAFGENGTQRKPRKIG